MRSIERRFNKIMGKNQNYSSYLCFAEAIRNQGFSKQMVHRWFYKLVDEDDYFKNETGQILRHLEHLSEIKKPIEDDRI